MEDDVPFQPMNIERVLCEIERTDDCRVGAGGIGAALDSAQSRFICRPAHADGTDPQMGQADIADPGRCRVGEGEGREVVQIRCGSIPRAVHTHDTERIGRDGRERSDSYGVLHQGSRIDRSGKVERRSGSPLDEAE